MPAPVTPKKPIVFRRLGKPEPEEKKRGAPPKKPLTPLEQTILKQNDGKLEVLPIPEKPQPGQEPIEFQSQQLAAVEKLMFQGIRSAHVIAQALSLKEGQAEKYIKAVLARWQALGAEVDIKAQRGEAIGYLDFMQNQLWTQYLTAKKIVDEQMLLPVADRNHRLITVKQNLMLQINNQLIALNGQRNQLYGLNPQTINQMLVMGGGDTNHEVLIRLKKQQGFRDMALKFASALEQAKREYGITNANKTPPTIDV